MASQNLLAYMETRGYIYLGEHSYEKFIEKEWWPRLRECLSDKIRGQWIPRSDKVEQLNTLMEEYNEWKRKKDYIEWKHRMYQESLTSLFSPPDTATSSPD